MPVCHRAPITPQKSPSQIQRLKPGRRGSIREDNIAATRFGIVLVGDEPRRIALDRLKVLSYRVRLARAVRRPPPFERGDEGREPLKRGNDERDR